MRSTIGECTLKIGDVPRARWNCGDIIEVWTPQRISWTHAQRFAHVTAIPGYSRNRLALRPLWSLSHLRDQLIYPYMFFRYGNSVVRIEQSTGKTETFGPQSRVVDGVKQHIHVAHYVKARCRHPKHKIYGEPGHELWYGGNRRVSEAALDQLWAAIALHTGAQEEQFQLAPAGRLTVRSHLRIRLAGLTDAKELQEGQNIGRHIAYRRLSWINWRSLYPSPRHQRMIESRWTPFDRRDTDIFDMSCIQTKPMFKQLRELIAA